MVDAAITDGDWVVVRQQPVADNGDIVAAMIDGEATVKTFRRKDGHVWLMPHNAAFEPIPGDDAVISAGCHGPAQALSLANPARPTDPPDRPAQTDPPTGGPSRSGGGPAGRPTEQSASTGRRYLGPLRGRGFHQRESARTERLDEEPVIVLGALRVGVRELDQVGTNASRPSTAWSMTSSTEKSTMPSSASSSETQWIFAVARPSCSTADRSRRVR